MFHTVLSSRNCPSPCQTVPASISRKAPLKCFRVQTAVSGTRQVKSQKDVLSFLAGLFCLLTGLFLFTGVVYGQSDDLFGSDPLEQEAPEVAPSVPAASEATGETGSGTEGTEPEQSSKGDSYLVWMFKALGWFFTPVFILLSLTMVALVVMNILAIRRSVLVPKELVSQFGQCLDDNRFQEAYQIANDDDSLLGKVLASGMSQLPGGYDKAVQTMQDIGQEETLKLEHLIGYLALIGNLAPMVGLFGTVVGMINSFQVIAAGGAAPSPQKLAEGIATALFTTEIGLAIALPALAVYDIFKNRLARFILEIGIISDNFMSRFSSLNEKKKN